MRRYPQKAAHNEDQPTAASLLVNAGQLTIIPCQITRRAEDGTIELKCPVFFPLPSTVFFMPEDTSNLLECATRWQSDTHAGLMIVDAPLPSVRKEILAKLDHAVVIQPPPEDPAEPPQSSAEPAPAETGE